MNSITLWNKNRTQTHPTYFRDLCIRKVTRVVKFLEIIPFFRNWSDFFFNLEKIFQLCLILVMGVMIDGLIDFIVFYAYRQYFRHVMADHGWQVKVKYDGLRLQWCLFSKIEWETSKLYALPDMPKYVKNLHDFIVHSLYISANIADIVWMCEKLMDNTQLC